MLFWLYNLLLMPLLFPYLAWRLLVRGKSREGLGERFGILPDLGPQPREGRVWVHAVSMGETVAAAPVVAAMRAALPGAAILVSTTTPTGQTQARRDLPQASLHFYFPFDLPWVTHRVLNRLQPSAIVLMEAEIWPNLLAAARKRGIPVVVANAHLSDRTLRRAMRLRPLLAPLFKGITRYLAQSVAIRDRAIALGMPPEQVSVVGHTKFDQQVPELTAEEEAAVRAGFGLAPGQPLFLAGSTHEGEEELILDAWEAARREIPTLALMLAPRHLARAAAIRALIEARGYGVQVRSAIDRSVQHGDTEARSSDGGEPQMDTDGHRWGQTFQAGREGLPLHTADPIRVHPRSSAVPIVRNSAPPCLRVDSPSPVLLLDTMGELAKFYGLASVAFVGGSLVPKGGHDILQPLFHQVPTLFGPYMHNQRALASLCRDAGAAREVAGAEELGKAVVALLDDTAERRSVLLAAERLLAENRGASTRCAAIVAELVEGRSGCSRQSARVGREPGTGNRAPDPGLPWRP